jgi:multidrug efflux pump subunit AcrA (membrane-fusion protein)
LNLNSSASIAQAQSALALAGAKIENIYGALSKTGLSSSSSSSSSASSAAAIAAAKAQVASYQQALSWLQNNSPTDSSSSGATGTVLSLF